jgi:signal transduction histidine kinase
MPPAPPGRYRRRMRARRSLLRRVRELNPTVADGLLAAFLTLLAVPQLYLDNPSLRLLDVHFRDPNALAVLLTLCQTVPLTWRRRAPYQVLAVTVVAAVTHLALGFKPTFAEAGMLVALYTVAAHRPTRRSIVAALLVAVALAVYAVISEDKYPCPTEELAQSWVLAYVQFAAAWFLGELQKRRIAYTAKLEALNLQLAGEQDLKAGWAVAEERGRIARELHDVVAHAVSVMVVQAGAARRSVASNPDQARDALASIESTGRQALAEMRRLVGLQRDRGEGEDAALAPQPSLVHLESLLAATRDAGLPVELTVEGEPRPLPAGVDLSAYRIVQEALTNSLKHAGPARATVRLCYGREALEVQVSDDGQGGGPNGRVDGGGHGLIGMRERVALFGGTLEVGVGHGGGFRVAARLPIDGTVAR